MELILASTSPYRRSLVERLGLPFRCVDPRIDEDALKAEMAGATPRELAASLARAKAEAVAASEPHAAVIGGDQLICFDGAILGKPGTEERAIQQLRAMSGRSHELITAIHVLHEGHSNAHQDVARLTIRPLTLLEIGRYVATDWPLDCAGSYKLESLGITLFESIESEDQTAIIGVPLMALTTILRNLGFDLP